MPFGAAQFTIVVMDAPATGARRRAPRRPATPLAPHDESRTPRKFLASKKAPFAIRWYGATSLYGHFRNFISRAIAAEQVDSRDWMRPQPPEVLLDRIADVLGAEGVGNTLIERLGRPLWIDFVADSGDDRDTSEAVAEMLAARYEVKRPDGTTRELPRGEILMFGGDTAYPVATAEELYRRLTEPWNVVFRRERRSLPEDRRRRVLMGVPGNHDWYDGLDGFGRLFRRSATSLPELDAPKSHKRSRSKIMARLRKLGSPILQGGNVQAKVGELGHKLHLDEVTGTLKIFGSVFRSMRAFLAGGGKRRRRRLVLLGYTAVQEASYFALPLAPGMDLWGVDRQLGRLDFRQRTYFRKLRALAPQHALMVCASDPFSAYGEPNKPGVQILEAVGLETTKDRFLYLTGDYHHYERRHVDRAVQVIGGGGGAFLHGTRINQFSMSRLAQGRRELPRPEQTYPSAAVSRKLLSGVPFKLVGGRAGYLVHLAGALVAWLELSAESWGPLSFAGTAVGVVLGTTMLLYFIAGHGSAHPRSILAVAVPFGVLLGALPALLDMLLGPLVPPHFGWVLVLFTAFVLTFVFGIFLTANAVLGLEHQQAFTVLGHTGFKHFTRLCVHPSGVVEAYAIGKDDPLAKAAATLLDQFDVELSADEPVPSSRAPLSG